MRINGACPRLVESSGYVVFEQFQATGKNTRCCRVCRRWLAIQVRVIDNPLRTKFLTVPSHRIFLPRDNQVLTLVLGGE